jgi:hypothetical protein
MKTLLVFICGIIALILLNTDNPYWWIFQIPLDIAVFDIYFKEFKDSLK